MAFGFSKKYDLSLLSIEGRVLDRCRAFDRLVSVDAHLWLALRTLLGQSPLSNIPCDNYLRKIFTIKNMHAISLLCVSMCIKLITATPPWVHAILFAYFDLKVLSSEMDPAVIRLIQ